MLMPAADMMLPLMPPFAAFSPCCRLRFAAMPAACFDFLIDYDVIYYAPFFIRRHARCAMLRMPAHPCHAADDAADVTPYFAVRRC